MRRQYHTTKTNQPWPSARNQRRKRDRRIRVKRLLLLLFTISVIIYFLCTMSCRRQPSHDRIPDTSTLKA